MFGQTTENKPAFAQSTGFGQIGGGTTFGQQTTGFGLNTQPSTSSSIFGKPPAFGATSSTTTTFGGFNTPATTNAFGANQNKAFGTTGTTSLFGSTQPQQQTTPFGSNLFGQTSQVMTNICNRKCFIQTQNNQKDFFLKKNHTYIFGVKLHLNFDKTNFR